MTIDSKNRELIVAALTYYYNANLAMAEHFISSNMPCSAAQRRDAANQILKLMDEIAGTSIKD